MNKLLAIVLLMFSFGAHGAVFLDPIANLPAGDPCSYKNVLEFAVENSILKEKSPEDPIVGKSGTGGGNSCGNIFVGDLVSKSGQREIISIECNAKGEKRVVTKSVRQGLVVYNPPVNAPKKSKGAQ